MTARGTWRDHISRPILREHLKWARGEGGARLVLCDCNLNDLPARGTQLQRARFERCTLLRADLSYSQLAGIELEGCALGGAHFVSSDMNGARLHGCGLAKADLRITRLRMAGLTGCDLSGALLDRADLRSAIIKETSFRGAFVYDATLDDACLEECNLRSADLSRRDAGHLCTARNTWFLWCDLRGANLEGRLVQSARFTRCRFHGVHGRPVVEGSCTIEEPDLSPNDDPEIGTEAQVLRMWAG